MRRLRRLVPGLIVVLGEVMLLWLTLTFTHDLPDRFAPMMVKELRQGLRRGSFVWPFLLLQVAAVSAVSLEFLGGKGGRADGIVGWMDLGLLFEGGPLWVVVAWIAGVLIPLAGFTGMRQELAEGNHELLLLTRLSRWRVVWGKFLVLWGLSALAGLSILPYILSRYLLGTVELLHELVAFLSVLGLAALISAGAIGASSYRSVIARCLYASLYSAVGGISILIVAGGSMMVGTISILYHLNMLISVAVWVCIGLARARAQLRLYVYGYEAHPGGTMLSLLFLAPFLVALLTLMTMGWGGGIGQLVFLAIVLSVDQVPSLPQARLALPGSSVPPPLVLSKARVKPEAGE